MANTSELRAQWLAALHKGGQWAYWWVDVGKRSYWWKVGTPAPLPVGKINVYVGVHPTASIPTHVYKSGERAGENRPPAETRAALADVVAVNCVFAEYDGKDFSGGKSALLQQIIDVVFPRPTTLIDSGGGYHAYWFFKETIFIDSPEQREAMRALQRDFVNTVGGDEQSKDLARILRVPDTKNYKPNYAPDYPLVTFVWHERENVFEMDELARLVIHETILPTPIAGESVTLTGPQKTRYGQTALDAELRNLAITPKGQRHGTLIATSTRLGGLVGAQVLDERDTYEAILATITTAGWEVAKHVKTIMDGLTFGAQSPRVIKMREPEDDRTTFDFLVQNESKTRADDGLQETMEGDAQPIRTMPIHAVPPMEVDYAYPEIQVNGRHLRNITADVVDVLLRAGHERSNVFVRGGVLHRIGRDEHHAPKLEILNESGLTNALTRTANFFSSKQTSDGIVRRIVDPPVSVTRDIAALAHKPFPKIAGIVTAPIMRADGTLLDTAGYDAATGIYYAPASDFDFPGVPDAPTQDEAIAARKQLSDLLSDFPFVDAASHANMLAACLTLVLRELFGHVPLLLIDATSAGTGKSRLGRLPGLIFMGHMPMEMVMPVQKDEWSKTITGAVLAAPAMAIFDNVMSEINSGEFMSLLTTDIYSCRLLGVSMIVDAPHRIMWVANGNNIKVINDFASRTYWVRMDSKIARPWNRPKSSFHIPEIEAHVLAHRGQILSDMLTMGRAWIVAGRPEAPHQINTRFSDWAHIIGGVLHYAGEPNFLGNITALYNEVDTESPEWEAFFTEVQRCVPGEFTVGNLCAAIGGAELNGNALADLIPSRLGEALDGNGNLKQGFKVRLGKALAARNGTRFGDSGVFVTRLNASKNDVVKWKVTTS